MNGAEAPTIGPLLRTWRQRRRLSQLDLANASGVAARHVSFVETGRSRPSREMVLHLAEHLDVPLRERNNLLVAAGYAPTFRETELDSPEFQPVREALDRVLVGHEPYPAIVVDRRWNLVAANGAIGILVEGVAPWLLAGVDGQVNVLRTSLHPEGLFPRIRNGDDWAEHIIGRLRRQILIAGDDELVALEAELVGYVADQGVTLGGHASEVPNDLATPLRLESSHGDLALITTLTTFGTALDITLAELALEAFLPGDEATAKVLSALAEPDPR